MFKINNDKIEGTKSNKKIILISSIAAIAVILVIGLVILTMNNGNKDEVAEGKTIKLYESLEKKGTYSFSTTLDEQNKMYYAKENDTAYVDTIYEGEESKFVVRDGNSYLLNDEDKVYYTYQNNEMDLRKIEGQLEDIKDLEYVTGKEKIGNKQYKYEEYEVTTEFIFKYFEDSEMENAKTRFYYDGDKMVYIKTIIGDYEELLKVDISYDVNSKLFEIPSDYKEG